MVVSFVSRRGAPRSKKNASPSRGVPGKRPANTSNCRHIPHAALRARLALTKLGTYYRIAVRCSPANRCEKADFATMTLPASLMIVDEDRELGQLLTASLTGA